MSWVALSSTGPRFWFCKGKSFKRRILHGNEEEGKKEKALTTGGDYPRFHFAISLASPEKHLSRGLTFCVGRTLLSDAF